MFYTEYVLIEYWLLVLYFALISIYWSTYFVIRTRMLKPGHFLPLLWIGNLFLGIYGSLYFQIKIWNSFGIFNFPWILSTVMVLGIVIHHLMVYTKFRKFKKMYSSKVHNLISHFLFFVPYGILTIIFAFQTYSKPTNIWELLIWILFVISSLIISSLGILVGLKRVKFSYS